MWLIVIFVSIFIYERHKTKNRSSMWHQIMSDYRTVHHLMSCLKNPFTAVHPKWLIRFVIKSFSKQFNEKNYLTIAPIPKPFCVQQIYGSSQHESLKITPKKARIDVGSLHCSMKGNRKVWEFIPHDLWTTTGLNNAAKGEEENPYYE